MRAPTLYRLTLNQDQTWTMWTWGARGWIVKLPRIDFKRFSDFIKARYFHVEVYQDVLDSNVRLYVCT